MLGACYHTLLTTVQQLSISAIRCIRGIGSNTSTWTLVTILDAGLVFWRISGPRKAGPDERKHYMCRSGPAGLVPPTQQEYFLVSLNTTTVFGLA